jgi:hypothetical protein
MAENHSGERGEECESGGGGLAEIVTGEEGDGCCG